MTSYSAVLRSFLGYQPRVLLNSVGFPLLRTAGVTVRVSSCLRVVLTACGLLFSLNTMRPHVMSSAARVRMISGTLVSRHAIPTQKPYTQHNQFSNQPPPPKKKTCSTKRYIKPKTIEPPTTLETKNRSYSLKKQYRCELVHPFKTPTRRDTLVGTSMNFHSVLYFKIVLSV